MNSNLVYKNKSCSILKLFDVHIYPYLLYYWANVSFFLIVVSVCYYSVIGRLRVVSDYRMRKSQWQWAQFELSSNEVDPASCQLLLFRLSIIRLSPDKCVLYTVHSAVHSCWNCTPDTSSLADTQGPHNHSLEREMKC